MKSIYIQDDVGNLFCIYKIIGQSDDILIKGKENIIILVGMAQGALIH